LIMAELAIGQTVELNDGRTATIRFIGQTEFAAGEWIGVELEDNGGKNDGSVKGERYFECEMGRGMFVRLAAITAIIDQPPPTVKPAGVKKAARPSSVTGPGPGLGKRLSGAPDPAAGKRMSMNAASPSPAARGSRPSSMLRVSVKLPISEVRSNCFAVSNEISYEAALCSNVECLYTTNWHPFKCEKSFRYTLETQT
jgi:dynactin 1